MTTFARLAVALLLIAAAATGHADAPPAGPHGFPLPADAKAPSAAPGGGGKIQVYEVPRGRGAVADELRAALKKGGWTITSDETSPRGSVRMAVNKGGINIKASVAGDDAKTAIILTLP